MSTLKQCDNDTSPGLSLWTIKEVEAMADLQADIIEHAMYSGYDPQETFTVLSDSDTGKDLDYYLGNVAGRGDYVAWQIFLEECKKKNILDSLGKIQKPSTESDKLILKDYVREVRDIAYLYRWWQCVSYRSMTSLLEEVPWRIAYNSRDTWREFSMKDAVSYIVKLAQEERELNEAKLQSIQYEYSFSDNKQLKIFNDLVSMIRQFDSEIIESRYGEYHVLQRRANLAAAIYIAENTNKLKEKYDIWTTQLRKHQYKLFCASILETLGVKTYNNSAENFIAMEMGIDEFYKNKKIPQWFIKDEFERQGKIKKIFNEQISKTYSNTDISGTSLD